MIDIAILGYGVVGSGVVEVLNTNSESIERKALQPIRVKKVCDIRNFPNDPIQEIITHDFEEIINDPEIKIVVEVIGGIEPAFTFVKRALLSGKSVVTSNKELVAKHGSELLQLARENKVNYLFEASVGGGIPIIRNLNLSLTADEIYEIYGILNGTTNYVLTKMTLENVDYADALASAQVLGYAEQDPSADVLGTDACRKIAILLSLAIGKQVNYENVPTEGISKITNKDIRFAKKLGGVIKMLGVAKITGHHAYARIYPAIIGSDHPLYWVNDVFNGIIVKGNVIDEVMFYGKGAGKLPTASAVVADIVDAAKHLNINIVNYLTTERFDMLSKEEIEALKNPTKMLIRIKAKTQAVDNIFGQVKYINLEGEEEVGFICNGESERDLNEKIQLLKSNVDVTSVLRIEGRLGGIDA